MNVRTQRLCVWSGTVMIVLWLTGFWALAHFVPPPSPNKTAIQIADVYRDHTNMIRAGLILSVIGVAFLGPFVAVISTQMRRIEGRMSPLALLQLGLGSILVLEFAFPLIIMEACTFRRDRNPEIVQAMNDMAWLIFLALVSTAFIQVLVIGIVILRDQNPQPILPRWMGYLSVWTVILWTPGDVTIFFKTGPLAWDGVFVWWVPVGIFAVWLAAITWCLLKAISAQEAQPETVPEGAWEVDIDARVVALAAELAAIKGQLPATVG